MEKPNQTLPDLMIFDDFLPPEELAYWQKLVQTGQESVCLYEDDIKHTELYRKCHELVGGLPLIHLILLNVFAETYTEVHRDIGEYVTLFYPFTNLNAPLQLANCNVDLIENRLVQLNCTTIDHRQINPTDGSVRSSIALKWRLPLDGRVVER